MRTSKPIPPLVCALVFILLSFSCSTTDISEPPKPSETNDTALNPNTNTTKTLDYLALRDSYTVGAGVPKNESFQNLLKNLSQAKLGTANKESFVTITDITTQGIEAPELVTTDNLHPSGNAYAKFVERIVASILPSLKD